MSWCPQGEAVAPHTRLGAASFAPGNCKSLICQIAPDDEPFNLVEIRRQLTKLRSRHSDNLLVTSRLNRFLVKIAFLSEPKDTAHEQHLRSEFVQTCEVLRLSPRGADLRSHQGDVKQPK